MSLRIRSWHSLSLPTVAPGNAPPEVPVEPSSSDNAETSSGESEGSFEYEQQIKDRIDAYDNPVPSHLDLAAYFATPSRLGTGRFFFSTFVILCFVLCWV